MSDIAGKIFRLFEPETAHGLAIRSLRLGLGPRYDQPDDPVLKTSVFGLDFSNPIGLAAGFDKNAQVPDAMLRLGFGFTETGTITPLPQPGNPRPRLFRDIESGAVINRMGFNGKGLDYVAGKLQSRKRRGIVGANVGRNKTSYDAIADYTLCIKRLTPMVDYLVINISSPNTPGLRDLQEAKALESLLVECVEARNRGAIRVPLLLKIAPDLDDAALAAIVEIAVDKALDGLIISNTTISRPDGLPKAFAAETGGLSGKPLFDLSTQQLRHAFRLGKRRIPLIGVGGVAGGQDAYRKIRAGASLVQLYTAMVFSGPKLIFNMKRELAACLMRDGFTSLSEAVGADA